MLSFVYIRCSHTFFFLFLILDCEAIGTAATPGLLCQPRVIVKMIVEKQMECRLAWGNRSSPRRKPAPAPLLSITKSHTWPNPGLNPCRRGGKPATNRMSYGAALFPYLLSAFLYENIIDEFESVIVKMACAKSWTNHETYGKIVLNIKYVLNFSV
jgi:hypothetical protein